MLAPLADGVTAGKRKTKDVSLTLHELFGPPQNGKWDWTDLNFSSCNVLSVFEIAFNTKIPSNWQNPTNHVWMGEAQKNSQQGSLANKRQCRRRCITKPPNSDLCPLILCQNPRLLHMRHYCILDFSGPY